MRRFLRALLFAIVAGALTAPAAAQPYTLIDLGIIPGQEFTTATDINNQLRVVGTSGDQAVLWDRFGMHPLGVTVTGKLHINNDGIVAGVRVVAGRRRPFVWINGSTFEPPAPAEDIQAVRELTDNGLLLMEGTRSYLLFGQTLFDLTSIFGGSVFAINQDGMLGGIASNQPFLRFADGRVITPWAGTGAPVRVIGAAGHFAGFQETFTFQPPWHYGLPDGRVTTIQPFGTGVNMSLAAMNRAGDLVGGFHLHGGRFFGFLYRGGTVYDLNTLLVGTTPLRLTAATGINDLGYIIATAREGTSFTPTHAVVLVPAAPAPPTALTSTVTGNVVTLQWSASVGALEYIVEAGSASNATNVFNASVGAQTMVSGAVPAGRYFVRVRAKNAVGVSAPSSEIIIDVP
jgi:hypothetical protein